MSVNQMQFEQASSLLTAIYNQATGQSISVISNLGEYVTVGNILLQSEKDPILRAISQMVSRTIIGIRPYEEQLRGMEVSSEAWGGIVRKLSYLDKKIKDFDDAFPHNPDLTTHPTPIVDGMSLDPWIQNKPVTIQTNFYGGDTYQDVLTIYDSTLKSAFLSPEGMSDFISGSLTNMTNKLRQMRENWKRICLCNMIGGRLAYEADTGASNGTVVHLITVYKAQTGNTTITSANWKSNAEIIPFTRWLYGFLNTLVSFMAERSLLYHTPFDYANSGLAPTQGVSSSNVGGLMRQTAVRDMKVYLLTDLINQIDSQVRSDTYHENMLKWVDFDKINFFQSITNPTEINVTPTYLLDDGTLDTPDNPINETNVVGVIFDRDAMGISVIDEGTNATSYNPRFRGYNEWYHETVRFWNDFSENSVVLIMD